MAKLCGITMIALLFAAMIGFFIAEAPYPMEALIAVGCLLFVIGWIVVASYLITRPA